ncbi:MAG: 2-dehydropantoate 2-reductase N-terminal domain-containing protein [Desulfobacterales bacterium]
MKPIRNVAILGAGAMGAYFAASFGANARFTTHLIASGERRERLERDGLVVNDAPVFITTASPEDAPPPVRPSE